MSRPVKNKTIHNENEDESIKLVRRIEGSRREASLYPPGNPIFWYSSASPLTSAFSTNIFPTSINYFTRYNPWENQ